MAKYMVPNSDTVQYTIGTMYGLTVYSRNEWQKGF